jgi:hemoglobin
MRYVEKRGHPRLRMRHVPFAITPSARDRWVELMSQALQEVQLPAQAVPPLRQFFEQAATFMINRAAEADADADADAARPGES